MGRRDQFIEHLAQVPLFSALSRKELTLVARRAEDVVVPAGKVLVSEGETGQQFFVIMSGTSTLTRRGKKIASLGPGDAFGELARAEVRELGDVGERPRDARCAAHRDHTVVDVEVFGGGFHRVRGDLQHARPHLECGLTHRSPAEDGVATPTRGRADG